MLSPWPALRAAVQRPAQRAAFTISGTSVGSVAEGHAAALAAWPEWLDWQERQWCLTAPEHERELALATINAGLRQQGLIKAWRDEAFALLDPGTGAVLSRMERAACRFWGTLTRGAHCNGYVADAAGRPTHVWIAQRAWNKATDPGMRDNLIGGGVPLGQTPYETLMREAWEEAGLPETVMQRVQAGRVIRVNCDVVEGRMVEDIHVFDLELPHNTVPCNQDGEVANFSLMTVGQASDCAASGEMTTDAALVTLDFLLRHRLLADPAHHDLAERLQPLLRPEPVG